MVDNYQLVQHVDGNAGFCAILTYTLNGIRLALRDGAIPVVNYTGESTKFFYESRYGPNVWDYYFLPVAGIGYDELNAKIANGSVLPEQVSSYTRRQICQWHHSDPDRVATFWAKDEPEDPATWMKSKRELGRKLVADHIRVKPHITGIVDAFCQQWIEPQFTIGVHIRGTDFAYAEPTTPEQYFSAIERFLSEHGQEPYRIFLATDQNQFVDLFRDRFEDRVITYDALRSNSRRPPFKFSSVSPYKRGEDVLIDVLLLSRCDFLFKGAAAGGEYALWFNSALECHDFALESEFDPRHFKELETAYYKLNIGQWSPPWWKPTRWSRVMRDLWFSLQRRIRRISQTLSR